MVLNDILVKMTLAGNMSPAQAERLKNLEEEKPFSVYRELRALLYLGALLVTLGLGATVKKYFDLLGPWTVLGALIALFLSAVAYCFKRGGRFDRGIVSSPTFAFDYILYLGCVAWGLASAYTESRFHIFGEAWKMHFLISSVFFFFLSYRFDNRIVLSLGLTSLSAWFGLELQAIYAGFMQSHRTIGLVFGSLAAIAAYISVQLDYKSHFQDVYGNFAGHFILIALVSGTIDKGVSLYFIALLVVCAMTAAHAIRTRKYFYMVYAVLYGYAGVSSVLLHKPSNTGFILLYFIVSSIAVGAGLYKLTRLFREEA